MTDTLDVIFTLRLADGTHVEERDLAARAAEVAAVLGGDREPYGRLLIRGGGQATVMFADDLLPMADTLAAVVATLREGKDATLAAFAINWSLRLEHVPPGRLRAEDQNGAQREDPAAALTAALAAAAQRLVALLAGGKLRRADAAPMLARLATALG